MKKIGVLTGGGDCPGLNAVIRAVVRRSINTYHKEVLGIREGWAGLVKGKVEPLTLFSVSGILPRGGTILGTSRTNPLKSEEKIQMMMANIKRYGIDGTSAWKAPRIAVSASPAPCGAVPDAAVFVPRSFDSVVGPTPAGFASGAPADVLLL